MAFIFMIAIIVSIVFCNHFFFEKNSSPNYNLISYYVETGEGTNIYEKQEGTTWPEGYIFNEEKSSCVNGSDLEWNLELQSIYMTANKGDKCNIYFDKYNVPVINNVSVSAISNNSITLNVTAAAGTGSIVKYFYSNDNGNSWVNGTSNKYTFNNLKSGTTYNFKVYVEDVNGYQSEQYSLNATTENAVLLADYIKKLYTSQGSNGIYLHNSSLANSANDGSYRYTGADPSNYVCFGSDSSSCSDNNLYRIIGVFGNQVKLIKYTAIGEYYWSGSSSNSSNSWANSTLNKTVLNTTYLNGLGTWANKIANTKWYVGGLSDSYAYSKPATAYRYELGANKNSLTYDAKIGLLYVSEYFYAASPSYWTYNGYDSSRNDYRLAKDSNWLYTGNFIFTISRNSASSDCAFIIYTQGHMNNGPVNNQYSISDAHPVFNLLSSVTYVSGNGSYSNPYQIS